MISNIEKIQTFAHQTLLSYYSPNQYCTEIRVIADKEHLQTMGEDLYLYICPFEFALDDPLLAAIFLEEKAFFIIEQKGSHFQALYSHCPDLSAYHQLRLQKIAIQKKMVENERQRFRIAVENTPTIVFEYDIDQDFYSSYGTLAQPYEKQNYPMEQNIPHFMEHYIHTLAAPDFVDTLTQLLLGQSGREGEFRAIFSEDGPVYGWVRATITPVYDHDGKISKTIGKFVNIQTEKEKELALWEANSRDALTRLYNKETGIRMVQEYMEQKEPSEVCCLMLFDMDNFQELNEKQGHFFADAVLQEVADIIRSETSPDDIQIRLGGDEFMLFVKYCDKSRATILGPRIAAGIKKLFQDEIPGLQISASIGICVTAVLDQYSGLYRCAESTLKYVKTQDKGYAAC